MSRFMDDFNGKPFIKSKVEVVNPNSIEKNRSPNLNYLTTKDRNEKINTLNYTKQYLNNQAPVSKINVSTQGLSNGFTGQQNLEIRRRILGKTVDELHTKTYQKKDLNKMTPSGIVTATAKRIESIPDLTVFPKTDSNIECFQNYQKEVGALGYLQNAVPKQAKTDGYRPPKTTGRETLESYKVSNMNAGKKPILKHKDKAKPTGRETLKPYKVSNVRAGRKPTSMPKDKAKKTVRETLDSYEVSNVRAGRKPTKMPKDKAKKTGRETLDSYEVSNIIAGKKATSIPKDKLKKTIRETLKNTEVTNFSGPDKPALKPQDKLKKTIRETLKANDITNFSGPDKPAQKPQDKLKKTIRETMKPNPVTNAQGIKKAQNKLLDKAKKTQRETLQNKPPSNVTGGKKQTKLPEDTMKQTKIEMNFVNKNNGSSGPATSNTKKNMDISSSENVIFKAEGKTEKVKRFSSSQGPKKITDKKNIGRFKDKVKLKGTSLQTNLQHTIQQKSVGSTSVNKCNFKARSLKNNRTFNSGFIEGMRKTKEGYDAQMSLKKRQLGNKIQFNNSDNIIKSRTEKIRDYEQENESKINTMLLDSMFDDLREEAEEQSRNRFMTFEEAKNMVVRLGLRTEEDWDNWVSKNKLSNIPKNPDKFYRYNGWVSWNDWLGIVSN